MATYTQRLKWKWQKFLRALGWPRRALKECRRLYKTMGSKGLFWHMAIQGRWHFGVTLALSLLTLPLLYYVLLGFTADEGAAVSWFLAFPAVAIVGFTHYVLLRASTHLRNKIWTLMTRLYAAPMLVLCGVLVLAAILQITLAAVKVFL